MPKSAVSYIPSSLPETSRRLNRALARDISLLYPRFFMRSYAYWKTKTDPVYAQSADLLLSLPETPLLDLGCGAGLFPIYLRKRGFTGILSGLDIDQAKIALARSITDQNQLNIGFTAADFSDLECSNHSGHVTLLDVLQFVDGTAQEKIVRQAAACLKDSHHHLIVRNALRDSSWRSAVSVTTDHFTHWIRWMPAQPSHHPSRERLEGILGECGLKASFHPLWGATPFNNYLIVASRS